MAEYDSGRIAENPQVETKGRGGSAMILLAETEAGSAGDATMPRHSLVGSST
jgi:hypothetical protein